VGEQLSLATGGGGSSRRDIELAGMRESSIEDLDLHIALAITVQAIPG